MSGNRANASARNKRAGGAEISNPIPGRGQQPGQMQQQQQQGPPPKLSISDAIGLITLRLGRVEGIVQTIQSSPNDPTTFNGGDDNSALIDKTVFDSIVKRLEMLEKRPIVAAPVSTTISSPSPIPTAIPNFIQLLQNYVTLDRYTKEMKEVKEVKESKESKEISELKTEIAELKDMLMKLQSFTMETNNKLVNVIFNESPRFELNHDDEEEEEEEGGGEEGGDGAGNECIIGEYSSNINFDNIIELSQNGFNLKEMIQHELCKGMQQAQNDIIELVDENV